MAIFKKDQQFYLGKGPLDAKSTIKTYAELLDSNTWTKENIFCAYNGMIVAVWLNKDDTSKNGVYFLFDPAVNSAIKKPDVTNADNWHKLVDISEVAALATRLSGIDAELESLKAKVTSLEEESDVITYGYRSGFPAVGESNKLYIAADEKKSYMWFAGEYMLVSGADEPDVIYGGSAD